MRRIVQQQHRVGGRILHPSDVDVSPQWHQWLRHVRADAPSLEEQARDVVRLRDLKVLAARADEKWDMKRVKIEPGAAVAGGDTTTATADTTAGGETGEARGPALGVGRGGRERGKKLAGEQEQVERRSDVERDENNDNTNKQKEDPWKQARRNPGEEWQPESWGGRPAPAPARAPAAEKRR